MVDNRTPGIGNPQSANRETVCIDTMRVLDSCRDRDCYENTRVYLTEFGQDALNNATSIRAKNTEILWSYVNVEPVTFNRGFYRVTVKTYLLLTLEACLGIIGSQDFGGLCILEKNVILYGGDGNITSYRSIPGGSYCAPPDFDSVSTSLPVGVVEAAQPMTLALNIIPTPCTGPSTSPCDIPERVQKRFDAPLCMTGQNLLFASVGIFSIVRIERPTQILVQATDYRVPDKECLSPDENDPCSTFRQIPFPVDAFSIDADVPQQPKSTGICGCHGTH